MAKLYIVATPIGNMEDITLRALRVLGEVSCILAEDTRVAKKLLTRHEIHNALRSFHAHSTDKELNWILEELKSGNNLAVITDAGTPGISDPGSKLVKLVREQSPDVEIVAVPGASALTAAFSIAGILDTEFVFLGFLPHKKGRQTILKEIAGTSRPVVFYESTHRIEKLLKELGEFLPETRKIILAKELTKMHENILIGNAQELQEKLSTEPALKKGEFVVIIE